MVRRVDEPHGRAATLTTNVICQRQEPHSNGRLPEAMTTSVSRTPFLTTGITPHGPYELVLGNPDVPSMPSGCANSSNSAPLTAEAFRGPLALLRTYCAGNLGFEGFWVFRASSTIWWADLLAAQPDH